MAISESSKKMGRGRRLKSVSLADKVFQGWAGLLLQGSVVAYASRIPPPKFFVGQVVWAVLDSGENPRECMIVGLCYNYPWRDARLMGDWAYFLQPIECQFVVSLNPYPERALAPAQ